MGQRIDLPTLSGVADYRQITPTDIAQFIRLDQCERYLRLRLHTRAMGAGFMKAYGVVPQSIPPLLTRSGERFEDRIEQAVAAHVRTANLAQESAGAADRDEDNARLIAQTRALSPGETVVLFQPRLRAEVDGWRMRGDVDILRLARDEGGGLHVLIADMKSSTASRVEHRLQVRSTMRCSPPSTRARASRTRASTRPSSIGAWRRTTNWRTRRRRASASINARPLRCSSACPTPCSTSLWTPTATVA